DADAAWDALAWYRGDLLPGDRYEEWATDRRERLQLRRLDVLRVAGEWREVAELDPTDEDAHVELMRRHLAAGDSAAALRQYDHLERVLERELAMGPGAAARQARLEADGIDEPYVVDESSTRVGDLLAELALLVSRQQAVLAELASVGASPDVPVPLRAVA
ncbi:MAG TPA: bacterial transcriptional activator domain-containing protein, partial [Ilumatobacteraceae bacterium]